MDRVPMIEVHDEADRTARCLGTHAARSLSLKWSRSFGQVEGFGKVYSGCEVKPSWSSCPANADKIPGRAWIVFR